MRQPFLCCQDPAKQQHAGHLCKEGRAGGGG
ncbi:hypothetical protein FKM82_024663 [Ascaphus truei]